MKPKLCPNNSAPMVADVAKGVWRCTLQDCGIQKEKRGYYPDACILEEEDGSVMEYVQEMSPAEIMAATGAKGLFDVGD